MRIATRIMAVAVATLACKAAGTTADALQLALTGAISGE